MDNETLQNNIDHEQELITAYRHLVLGYEALSKMPEHAKNTTVFSIRAKNNKRVLDIHKGFLAELQNYRGDE